MKLEKYKSVGLRNLKDDLILIECGEIERLVDDDLYDDEDDIPAETIEYKKYEIYIQPENNNLILALFNTFEREYLPADVMSSVSSGIRDEAYDYLIDALNTNENMFIQWTQIEGTTSDYKIFYDILVDDDCWKKFSDVEHLICRCGGKYTEVRNGKLEAIRQV